MNWLNRWGGSDGWPGWPKIIVANIIVFFWMMTSGAIALLVLGVFAEGLRSAQGLGVGTVSRDYFMSISVVSVLLAGFLVWTIVRTRREFPNTQETT